MKSLRFKLLTLISTIICVLAAIVTSTASYWIIYQPKAPKRL